MGIIKADSGNPDRWGVVYSYGSVLAVFDSFGGAVVRLACSLWNTLERAAEGSMTGDQSQLA